MEGDQEDPLLPTHDSDEEDDVGATKKVSLLKKIANKVEYLLKKPPNEYLCPISRSLMENPETIASGHTLDSSSINACIRHTKYPVLRNGVKVDFATRVPNVALKNQILQWCRCKGFSNPKPISLDKPTKRLNKLMMKQPPDNLVCPFTNRLMVDPVQVSTTDVVERKFLEACNKLQFTPELEVVLGSVKQGNSKIVHYREVVFSLDLSRTDIQDGVQKWCAGMKYGSPEPIDDDTAMRFATRLRDEKAVRSEAARNRSSGPSSQG